LHRTDLIIFPLTLLTITIALMISEATKTNLINFPDKLLGE